MVAIKRLQGSDRRWLGSAIRRLGKTHSRIGTPTPLSHCIIKRDSYVKNVVKCVNNLSAIVDNTRSDTANQPNRVLIKF